MVGNLLLLGFSLNGLLHMEQIQGPQVILIFKLSKLNIHILNFRVSLVMLSFEFAGQGVQSQTVTSPKMGYATNGNSSNANNYSQEKHHLNPGSSDSTRAQNYQSAPLDDSGFSMRNGNANEPWTVNSRIANLSGADFEKISSQQALKRTLPPSLQPLTPSTRFNNVVEDMASSQVHDTYENSYHLAGPSVSNNKGYMRDHFSRGKSDEVVLYDNSGSRILPPSLMHGKAISSHQFASSSDPLYRSMIGEERQTENDERLIYQAALEVFLPYLCSSFLIVSCHVFCFESKSKSQHIIMDVH